MPHKILIADDDPGVTTVLGVELAADGYRIETCGDGLTAMERVIAFKPQLVILDYQMPGIDGRSVCSRLRRSLVGVRIIMLTAAREVADRVAGLDAGADDYLCKPFDLAELRARVRAHLRDIPAIDAEEAGPQNLSIQVLGGFGLQFGGVEVSGLLWNRRQPLLLLKLLLARYDRPVLSDVLETAIWPDLDADRARRSLHVAVQRLRTGLRSLGPSRVQTCPGGYAFRLQPDDDLDLKRLDEIVARTSAALTDDTQLPAEHLRALAALYAGDLFSEEPYFDPFDAPRQQLHHAVLGLLRRGAARSKTANPSLHRLLLQRLADLEPTNEDAALALAEHLLDTGDTPAALESLHRIRESLRTELEVPPSPRWTALLERAGGQDSGR